MNASLAQRNDYQVKCYELNLAQLSGRLQWRRDDDDDDDEKRRWVHQKKAQRTRPNCFLEAEPNPKSRTYVADRTPAKEPNLRKREGKALTSPGNPLTNLTTVKLSRKKMSENLRPNVCGKYALQGSSRALYTPLYPTHKQCTWPVPVHEVGCAVLIWSGSDLVVWCGGSGLIW